MDFKEREVLREVFSKRIDAFASVVLEHRHPLPFSPKFHLVLFRDFYEKLGTGARVVWVAPRGYGKSSIMEDCILWLICQCSYPRFKRRKHFIIIASDTESQAIDRLKAIKSELENNQKIAYFYPEVYGEGPVWKVNEIVTRNDICVIALGMLSKFRGRKYKHYRPDLVIVDDPMNLDILVSEAYKKSIEERFNRDIMYCGGRAKDFDIFVIGTKIASDCLVSKLASSPEYASFDVKEFKAVLSFSKRPDLWEQWKRIYTNRDNPHNKEDAYKFFLEHEKEMMEGAEVLWEAQESYYDLMVMKEGEGHERAFYAEKQGEPQALDTYQPYKPEDIRYYDKERFEEIAKKCRFYIYLDPTVGKNKKSDLYGLVVIAKYVMAGEKHFYCVYANEGRKPPTEQMEEFINLVEIFSDVGYIGGLGVEGNGFQCLISGGLMDKMREKGLNYRVIPVVNTKDKVTRILALEPHIKSGRLRFNPDLVTLYYRLRSWTPEVTRKGKGSDDLLDALASCFELANKKQFKLIAY